MQSALIKSASEALNTQRVADEASHVVDPSSSSNNTNFVSISEQLQRQSQTPLFSTTDVRLFSEISAGRTALPITSQPPPSQILATIHHQQPFQQEQQQSNLQQSSHIEPSENVSNVIVENKDITTSLNNAAAQQPLHFDQAVGYLNKIKVFNIFKNILIDYLLYLYLGAFCKSFRNLS